MTMAIGVLGCSYTGTLSRKNTDEVSYSHTSDKENLRQVFLAES